MSTARERVTQKWNAIRGATTTDGKSISILSSQPWPIANVGTTPNNTIAAAVSSAAATPATIPSNSNNVAPAVTPSSSTISAPPSLTVTITTLNQYSDLSEVSGIVLAPGFTRSINSSVRLNSADPVPSHIHTETYSPTLLPPLPSLEARREAQDAANSIQERDDKESASRSNIQPTTTSLADTDRTQSAVTLTGKLKETISRLTTTTLASPSPTAVSSSSPSPAASGALVISSSSSSVAPSPPSSTTSTWLSSWRRSPFAPSSPLDSISAPSSATKSASLSTPPNKGRWSPRIDKSKSAETSKGKSTAKTATPPSIPSSGTNLTAQTAQKRTNSIMQQLWLFSSSNETSVEAPKALTQSSKPESSPKSMLSSSSAAPISTSSSSSLSSIFRSSVSALSSAYSTALYYTLGPLVPYVPPPPIVEKPTTDQPVSTPSAPPPPPPPWTTMRKVVIIGVHGWSLMGGLMGERPIVISTKFCQMAQRALATFCKDRQVNLEQIQVCTIPLHGHGKVETRIESYLHHQLPMFQPYITTADAIFVVAHSQGVLVAVSVLHQLILQGWVNPRIQHVSMQLMAGPHNGPFPDLPSDLWGATKELFSYSYQDAEVHRRYMMALHFLMENAVKILCVGSMHDQVVPLYSSLLQSFPSCPNLLRGVYVDYSTYQPDFIHALLSLIVYLMNTGTHGASASSTRMIQSESTSPFNGNVYVEALSHLSGWLRGSLLDKNGGAHSAIHRLTDIYNLSMEWSLCSRGVITAVHVHTHSSSIWAPHLLDHFTYSRLNRYLLMMRLREMFTMMNGTNLNAEQELLRLYDQYHAWQPRTRQLRQLKDSLATLFDVTATASSSSTNIIVDTKKDPTSTAGATAPPSISPLSFPSTTTPSLPPPLDPVALRTLLHSSRLSILPVTLPASWQIHAPHTHRDDELIDEPMGFMQTPTTQTTAPTTTIPSSKRSKRVHFAKDVAVDDDRSIASTASSNENSKVKSSRESFPITSSVKGEQRTKPIPSKL